MISRDELTKLLHALGPGMFPEDAVEVLLSNMDSNNDGKALPLSLIRGPLKALERLFKGSL